METRCDRKFPTTTTKQHFFLFEINRERNTCALQSLYIFLLLLLLAFLLHSHSIFWFDRAQPRSHLLRRNKTPHLPKNLLYCAFVRSFSFTFLFPLPGRYKFFFFLNSPCWSFDFIHSWRESTSKKKRKKRYKQQTNKRRAAPPWCFIVLFHIPYLIFHLIFAIKNNKKTFRNGNQLIINNKKRVEGSPSGATYGWWCNHPKKMLKSLYRISFIS